MEMHTSSGRQSGLHSFFARFPVITTEEVDAFLAKPGGAPSPASVRNRKRLLQYHQQRGHITAIRRGLYASVPLGYAPDAYSVDTYLIAAKMADDAVLAYGTALAVHGLAHSMREERVCLSDHPHVRPFDFHGVLYRAVRPPRALTAADRLTLGVEEMDRQGLPLRVTTLERTLVDVLDRPKMAGGWEECWRSLESLDVYLDLDLVTRYALLLGNATTVAKVGYFLEAQRDRLSVEDRHLAELRRHAPQGLRSLVPVPRSRKAEKAATTSRLARSWNLLAPALEREPGGAFSGETGRGEVAQ